jgi:hypothetical protein
MSKSFESMEEVISEAEKQFNLKLINHNKQHGYAILSDGKDMVCIEKSLRVRLKERGYYLNDDEYGLNYEIYEWLRLDKLKYLQA